MPSSSAAWPRYATSAAVEAQASAVVGLQAWPSAAAGAVPRRPSCGRAVASAVGHVALSIASVRSHGGTPPASPRNGSTSSIVERRARTEGRRRARSMSPTTRLRPRRAFGRQRRLRGRSQPTRPLPSRSSTHAPCCLPHRRSVGRRSPPPAAFTASISFFGNGCLVVLGPDRPLPHQRRAPWSARGSRGRRAGGPSRRS